MSQDLEIIRFLRLVSYVIMNAERPDEFDIEQCLLDHKCSASLANLLSDYLPTACGQVFCREREIETSNFYQRMDSNENLGPEQRFEDDPLWKTVKRFSENLAASPKTRNQFSLLASQSEYVDAINKALNAGQSWEELKGAKFGNTIFYASIEP